MGTERRTTWLSRAACRGSVAIESIAPMERAVWAPSALRFQPVIDPRYPAARSANPTDVPSRPVPRMAMRSIMKNHLAEFALLAALAELGLRSRAQRK